MSDILDFGTDNNGLPGADWIDELPLRTEKEWFREDGGVTINLWVKRDSPIPRKNNSYSVIHTKYSLTWNYMSEWEFILREFKRLLRPGGFITMVECNSIDVEEGYTKADVRALLDKVFPFEDEHWLVYYRAEEDGEDLAFQAYITQRDY